MARGETAVTFDFEFSYSKGGQFVPTNRIVVRAPGLALLDIHGAMKSHVAQAQKGAMDFLLKAQAAREGAPEEAQPEDPNAEPDVLQLMSFGLSPDEHTKFLVYVKKVLSNRVALAYVGDAASPSPITDEIWDQIEEHGGIPAFEKIVNAFTSFFFAGLSRPTSTPTNGSAESPGSVSPTKAPLPMSRRDRTRSSA